MDFVLFWLARIVGKIYSSKMADEIA